MRRSSRRLAAGAVLLLSIPVCSPAAAAAEGPIAPLSDGAVLELPPLDPQVPSPASFLGYPLGGRFTHHERIVAYLEALAEVSPRVAAWRYGETYEGRPLQLVAVSSGENIARLEEIRRLNLGLADPRGGAVEPGEQPVIVWLAYGVHGNESSSAEAAMAAAYVLAAAGGEWEELLRRGVILIDPLQNPDGRERYVHFYETRRGRLPDPYGEAAEHREEWPGGRQNHYLFDLNRDWAWGTQRETRDRLAAYRRWEPQVHVDLHEMGSESTYFFPPASEPIHPHIDRATLGWLETFGRANAAAFDRLGWTYYVGEHFDLFYPGYGDSYPSLRGAVGMTYEMAGGGRAGQAIERIDGSLLTLADRVARHFTTSLATAEAAIRNRAGLLADFAAARRRPLEGPATTYLWSADQQEARAAVSLLELHGLEVRRLASEARLRVRPLTGGEASSRTFPAGTLALSTAQPLGALVRALMDLDAVMSEAFIEEQRRRLEQHRRPEFYDITAWSLPVAFGLETWVAEGGVADAAPAALEPAGIAGEGDLGFLAAPQGLAGYRFASRLQGSGIRHRLALGGFRIGERRYPAGTLFIPARGNRADLEATLAALAAETSVGVERVASAYVEEGISLGSDSMVGVRPARIGLVGGAGVSPTSFGFAWHLLDRMLELPHHRLELRDLGRLDLGVFDVLVLPDGGYGAADKETAAALGRWVEAGGVLVAVEDAISWLEEQELIEIESWSAPDPEAKREAVEVIERGPAGRPLYTPGAALATEMRRSHPLTAGLGAPPVALFRGTRVLLPSSDGRENLLVADRAQPIVAGFAWPEASQRLRGALLMGIRTKGEGAVVLFAQEPAFRLFWRSTAPLWLNSVLYGPSLGERGRLFE